MPSPRPGMLLAPAICGALVAVLVACSGPAPSTATAPASPSTSSSASEAPRATTFQPTPPPGVTSTIATTFRASGLIESGGLIWAEDHAETQTVYAIDPASGEVVGSVAMGRPCDLATVDGMVWAADLDGGAVLEIDPATFTITRTADGLSGPCGPQVAGGAVWVAVDQGYARVDLADLSTTITELGDAAFPGNGEPLWAMEYRTGALHRVNLKSGAPVVDIEAPGGPQEMVPPAIGFESLWVADAAAGTVFRLDPTTGEIQAEVTATVPTRLLVTSDAVWASSYPQGTIQRIDPATNEVVFRVRIGGNLNGMAAAGGRVWVADTLGGGLYGIDPTAVGIAD